MVITFLFAAALATGAADAYSHATFTGDYDDFRRAELAIAAALAESDNSDLHLLEAQFELTVHRLANAKRELAALGDVPMVRAVRADVAMQEGRYADARRLLRGDGSWPALARRAWLEWHFGDPKRADALYAEAQEQLHAKQMRSFAWLELQRGLMDLDARRYDDALAHYRRAGLAQPGWWLVEEHIAEVLALLGRKDEAIAIYRGIRNPSVVGALANLTNDDALRAEAERLFEHQRALYPEAASGHFIEYLLALPKVDARLVPMAEQNLALRPNAESKLLLARAYEKAGDKRAARMFRAVRRTGFGVR